MKKISFTFFLILCFTQICCGQKSNSPITKTQALRDVKVASIQSWKEIISDEGRFRILFPNEPAIYGKGNSGTDLRGFNLIQGEMNWFAYFNDYSNPIYDETKLREAYQGSVERITRKGVKLLKQNDVFVNKKLGTEFILEGHDAISYMRAFLIGSRMYTLAVDNRQKTQPIDKIPDNVEQFFDSFTFWEKDFF